MNKRKLQRFKVRIHPLFWVVTIAAVWTGQFLEVITLFTLVVIHELGHIFAALACGWRVRSMELLPFGGVAQVDESGSTNTKDEIIVALAGPFMNFLMILMALIFQNTHFWDAKWCQFFIQGNLLIASFNLLPIWPLDGGKIVQALLCSWYSFYRSVRLTILWSILMILFLFFLSFFIPAKINLIVICVYLLMENRMAWKKIQYQFIRFLLFKEQKIKSKEPMTVCSIYLDRDEKVGEVVKLMKKGCYHYIHVIDRDRRVIAIYSEEELLSAFFIKPQQLVSVLNPIY
ncbi:M50 family metallopeptidase [Ammoniphilus resinae]|uniref:Stage IV sporulation protein FB n=1 Tax=Ammoniphilus resinae TaxID=861532 RepID=A0ABS4GJI7_9BACL|nr:M50 family metallopeptidase [Ammoniphilus resinae]MBP1930414.1 stage IV sporulation protein FB [Ammoniphilus resinae]